MGVVEVETEVGYALHAQQTFAPSEMEGVSRMGQYLGHLTEVRPYLPSQVQSLAVDGAYAKERFCDGCRAIAVGCDQQPALGCKSALSLHRGTEEAGQTSQVQPQVDLQDLTRFTFVEPVQPQVDLYSARVWHVSLKREIRVAYLVDRRAPHRVRPCLLVSTDVEPDPQQIVQFYKLRFQIEFLFRDAKQFTGLGDCQARDLLKWDFHFNASFTALNLAKFDAHHQHPGQDPFVFSMASVKTACLQSTPAGTIYCHLRPKAESD